MSDACSELLYILPCQRNWDSSHPQPAGSLTMKNITAWPQEEFFSDTTAHFVCINTTNIPRFPSIEHSLIDMYDCTVANLKQTDFIKNLPVEVSNCVHTINKFTRYTEGENEATLRLVYADAMSLMICCLNDYMFKVEDRLVTEYNEDGIHHGVSERSIADYICYSIHGGKRVVAVIVETKRKFTYNALAQLIGYYFRVATDIHKPGICVLVTREALHIVVFPFYSTNKNNLVNAVCLKAISMDDITMAMKYFAILTSAYYNTYQAIMLPPDYFPIQKSFQYMIEREQDRRLRSLEEMIMKLKRENAELRCTRLPVTVSVSHIKQ